MESRVSKSRCGKHVWLNAVCVSRLCVWVRERKRQREYTEECLKIACMRSVCPLTLQLVVYGVGHTLTHTHTILVICGLLTDVWLLTCHYMNWWCDFPLTSIVHIFSILSICHRNFFKRGHYLVCLLSGFPHGDRWLLPAGKTWPKHTRIHTHTHSLIHAHLITLRPHLD